MNKLSQKTATFVERLISMLESPSGRTAFRSIVLVYGLLLGLHCVGRAELPKKILVEKPHYDSPLQAGSEEDTQAIYYSSEFRSFRALSWGAVVGETDQYTGLHTRAYPPFFAIAFFPFAVLWRVSYVGSTLFFVLSYGGSLLTAWCLARWWQSPGQRLRFGLFALIWLVLLPFTSAVLARCETDMLVVTPMAAALLLMVRPRGPAWAGALLGFAASFKVLPGLFGVYFICQRRWRAAAGMVAAGLVCMVLLPVAVWGPRGAWNQHVSWYRHVVVPYHTQGATGFIGHAYRSTNQSLTAAVHRFLTPIAAGKSGDTRQVNIVSLSHRSAQLIAAVLRALIGLGLIVLWVTCRRAEETPAALAASFATVTLGILLLSEVSLGTHHVTLIVPLAVLITRATCLKDEASKRLLWMSAVAVLVYLVGTSLTVRLLSPYLWATCLLLTASVILVLGDARRNVLNGGVRA